MFGKEDELRSLTLDCSRGKAGLSSAAPHVPINVNTIDMFVARPAQLKGENKSTEPMPSVCSPGLHTCASSLISCRLPPQLLLISN
ncbi:hypothetical protein EYF80_038231 [Liparis tanakae]|uniref:Uncharacterized protein n=1 Tax=Liparis tanakae TaxID=230148 RepID=A0A4Z2GFZ9_9TELE|nr:hypothetical protein EYF80_038231 [Liparis tanakae]